MEKYIWKNIEKWAATNLCLLDLIMCIEDPDSQDPVTRYKDFLGSFYKQFQVMAHSTIRHQSKYPFIGVDFSPVESENCNHTIAVFFRVVFNTGTTPQSCGDDACAKCISDPYMFKHCVEQALISMFGFTIVDEDGCVQETNLFDELRFTDQINDGQTSPWGFNVWAYPDDTPIYGKIVPREDQMLEFNLAIRLNVCGMSSCKECIDGEAQEPCSTCSLSSNCTNC